MDRLAAMVEALEADLTTSANALNQQSTTIIDMREVHRWRQTARDRHNLPDQICELD